MYMFSINEKIIKDLATNDRVYKKGLAYYRANRVADIKADMEEFCFSAIVMGDSDEYETEVYFTSDGGIFSIECGCPAFSRYEGACKHVVALLKECQSIFIGAPALAEKMAAAATASPATAASGVTGARPAPADLANTRAVFAGTQLANEMLESFGYSPDSPPQKTLQLEINLEIIYQMKKFRRRSLAVLNLRLGESKLYVVKNIKQLINAVTGGGIVEFGKHFTFNPNTHVFSPRDKLIIDLLHEICELEEQIMDPWQSDWANGQGKLFRGKQVILTTTVAKRLLSLLHSQGRSFNLKMLETQYNNLTIAEQDLPLEFALDIKRQELLLQWRNMATLPLLDTGEYFLMDEQVCKISARQNRYFLPLLNAFVQSPAGVLFSRDQTERFVAEMLPALRQIGRVEMSGAVEKSLHQADLHTRVHLDKERDAVTARVEFAYGEIRFNPFAAAPGALAGDKILVRDMEGESAVLNLFETAEFRTLNGKLYLKDDDAIYRFVFDVLPEIQERAEVFYSESFRSMRARSAAVFTGGVRLNEDNGMLEFSFKLDGVDAADLNGIFRSLREKKKYYRLRDGSFLPLGAPDSNLEQVMRIMESLDITERDLKKETVLLPGYRAMHIDRCLRESNLRFDRNQAFKRLVQNVGEPRDTEFTVPGNLRGTLRDYQRTGFKWLKTLAGYGLGGVLADDMGLGKTIQTIAFILSEKERVPAPSLVIAPTSVVYNWQDEVQKFAPGMQALVISGAPGEREALLRQVRDAGDTRAADLVVTSYALIRRDVERYRDLEFGYCFLDEAQHIKNPSSLGAKAVKLIKARGYFALTGTPLENSLTELWSVFDFVMRGYLHSHRKFMKQYERPIVKDRDQIALGELQRQIAPFIMRRLKKDVLLELPPKIESKVLTGLTDNQKIIYLAYLRQARGEFEAAVAAGGFEKSQIKILALLTRLRQICCHPATFLNDYKGDSGKLLYLREIMRDALKGGHRVLLFSQFTGMLAIIRNYLDSERINYFYLDGATKMEDRGQMVRALNSGERDAFLISLKAGGTGLNLTGADMVIHYDPWWNPAVEEQATDRAYRIGQKNSVQVIKLIARGTIEEKIYTLQQKKKAMIDSVIQPGETMLSKMTEQEIRQLFL